MVIMMMRQLNGAGLPNTLRGGKMIVAATAVSMAATASLGQMVKVPSFEKPRIFSDTELIFQPYGMTSADFDNDGYPDVVVAVRGPLLTGDAISWILLYRNLGEDDENGNWPGFAAPVRYFLDTDISTEAIQVAAGHVDPNLDFLGLPDVVVSAADSDQVYLFRNDSDNPGSFFQPTFFQLPSGYHPHGITLGDFGNDQNSFDIAVASATSDTVIFLQNVDGAGTFVIPDGGAVTLGTGVPARGVVAGEFDTTGAGPLDAMTPDWPSVLPCQLPFVNDSVSLLRNDGNFTFTVSQDAGGCGDTPRAYRSLAKGAFDGPQANDLAATVECRAFVDIILGNGLGMFSSNCSTDRYQVHPDINSLVDGVATGHLNGGTKTDIVVTVSDSHEVAILLGRGNGDFQQPTPDSGYLFSVRDLNDPAFGTGPRQVIVVDLDQDGFGDIVTSNVGEPSLFLRPSITVLINKFLVTSPPN